MHFFPNSRLLTYFYSLAPFFSMSSDMFPSTALVVQSLRSLHRKICKYLLQSARSAEGITRKYNQNSLPLANMQVAHKISHVFDIPLLYVLTHVLSRSQWYCRNLLGRFPKIHASNLPRTDSSRYQDMGFQVSIVLASCIVLHYRGIYFVYSHLVHALVSST